jgi:hypothetical protein
MEPGTPTPSLTLDGINYALAWNKRSEALLSSRGHNVLSLVQMLRKKREGFYGLCLGVWAALPPSHPFAGPEDLAEALGTAEKQVPAYSALDALWRHAYPATPAEKKSDSPSSSPGPVPHSTSASA